MHRGGFQWNYRKKKKTKPCCFCICEHSESKIPALIVGWENGETLWNSAVRDTHTLHTCKPLQLHTPDTENTRLRHYAKSSASSRYMKYSHLQLIKYTSEDQEKKTKKWKSSEIIHCTTSTVAVHVSIHVHLVSTHRLRFVRDILEVHRCRLKSIFCSQFQAYVQQTAPTKEHLSKGFSATPSWRLQSVRKTSSVFVNDRRDVGCVETKQQSQLFLCAVQRSAVFEGGKSQRRFRGRNNLIG